MCLEDIRLGRESSTNTRSVTTSGATAVTLCPPNPLRIRLTVAADGVNRVFVMPRNFGGSNAQGIPLVAGFPVQTFKVEDFGSALWQEWVAFDAGVATIVTVIETELGKT